MTDRLAAGVRITAVRDDKAPAGDPIDLRGRVIGFTYEQDDKKVDKCTLELLNEDGLLFDRPELLGGAVLEVSWGYPGDMSPPRRVVVRKLKDFSPLTIEAHGLAVMWNDSVRSERYLNATRSEIARLVAARHGYEGEFVDVDDTGERFDVITQAAQTDAWFLRQLAATEHFEFALDGGTFHFHKPRAGDAPEHLFTYFSGSDRGGIRAVRIESDLTRRVGSTTVKGRDPMAKKTVEAKANTDTVDRPTFGEVSEVWDKEDRTISTRPWNNTQAVHPSAASSTTQVKSEANARFLAAESEAVKLSLDIVGTPAIRARSVVEIRGLPARLSGRYRVREVKHRIDASGFGTTLKLARDAVGAAPQGMPTKRQGGESNTKPAPAAGTLDPVEVWDKERRERALEFRRKQQAIGGADPEGKR